MKLLTRFHTALLLTVIYSLILVSPLAPLMSSPAGGTKGACAGDCASCGCSPLQSANRTCCCWQKRRQASNYPDQEQSQLSDCCKQQQSRETVVKCGWPCGGNDTSAFYSEGKPVLPSRFGGYTASPPDDDHFSLDPARLTDRHGDPPDPPPRLAPVC